MFSMDAAGSNILHVAATNPTLAANWSVIGWFYGDLDVSVGTFNIIGETDQFRIRTVNGVLGSLWATANAAAATSLTVVNNRWMLLCASWDNATGTGTIFAKMQGDATTYTASSAAGLTLGGFPASDFRIGQGFAANNNYIGGHAGWAIRNHKTSQAEFEAIYAATAYLPGETTPTGHDLYGIMDYNSGVNWNGTTGLKLLICHACVYSAHNAIIASPASQYVGKALPTGASKDICVYNPDKDSGDAEWPSNFYDQVTVANNVTVTSTVTYRSPFDGEYAGFFGVRRSSGVSSVFAPIQAGARTYLSQIANLLVRSVSPPANIVLAIDGNSRAVLNANTEDDQDASTGRKLGKNFRSGFFAQFRSACAGVFNRATAATSGTGNDFGFSYDTAPFTAGTVNRLGGLGSTSGLVSFCKFWNGSAGTGDHQGPGDGVHVAPSGSICPHFRAETGSLLTADTTAHAHAHCLKFPGASEVSFIENHATANNAIGTDTGASSLVTMDTSIMAVQTVTAATGTTVAFADVGGTKAALITAGSMGDVAVCSSSDDATIRGCVRIVTVANAANVTTLTVDFTWPTTPSVGDNLRIGPVRCYNASFAFAAADLGGSETHRGIRSDVQAGGLGHVRFADSCWTTRTDAHGIVPGYFGWASHGYAEHLSKAEDTNGKADRAHIWLDSFPTSQLPCCLWFAGAQQNPTVPADLGQMIDVAREHTGAELGIVYECAHGLDNFTSATVQDWNDWILANAAAKSVYAVSVYHVLGSIYDQWADGMRDDSAHLQTRGNRLIADAWIDALDTISGAGGSSSGRMSRARGRTRSALAAL